MKVFYHALNLCGTVFKSMDANFYRFSTNQKNKDEFCRERAMGVAMKVQFYAVNIS